MSLRTRRSWAAIAALTVTTPALVALSVVPATAATGGGTLSCKTTNLLQPEQDAPFEVHVTANPTGPKAPSGAAVQVNNATVTVTMSGTSVGAIKASPVAATAIGLNQGIVKLDATHATGSLQVTNLSAPQQPITNYDATGGPGGVPTADPITFTMTGVNFGSVTTSGANGQSVDISLAADPAADGFILDFTGAFPTIGFGSLNNAFGGPGGDGFCSNDTAGDLGVPWAPSIASVALVTPPPSTFRNTVRPTVVGRPIVGRTLTCRPGSWTPTPTATGFRWLRDGKAMTKAAAARAKYKIVKADARHRLSCRVTVKRSGYTPATATSLKTRLVRRH